jgi:hypothetical protein
MMDEQVARSRRFRPRISLITVLLLMTVAGMAIVIAQLWREVGPLRAENKRFNEERGTLVLDDRNRLHAIRIPARFAGEGRTSFRVYVPPEQFYLAFVHVNDVPKAGLPERKKLPGHVGILGGSQGRLFARLGPGEHIVTVRTVSRGDRSDIQLIVKFASPNISLDASAMTPKNRWPTVAPETYSVFSGGVGAATVAADGREPLVLMRRRIMGVAQESVHVSYQIPEPEFSLDGLLLWVEQATN